MYNALKDTETNVKLGADEQMHILYRTGSELTSLLGMGKLEGMAYLTLLRTGPITASALSKEIGIERTKAYRIVDSLVSNGTVSITLSNPRLCVPVEPRIAVRSILQSKSAEIKRINQRAETLIQRVNEAIISRCDPTTPVFRIIQGQDSIYANIEQLMEDSQDRIFIVTGINDASKMYYSEIPDKAESCQNRAVDLRLVIDSGSDKAQEITSRLNIQNVRWGLLPSRGRLVVSESQVIMSDFNKLKTKTFETVDYALFTNSGEMVRNLFSLCNFLWDTSNPLYV